MYFMLVFISVARAVLCSGYSDPQDLASIKGTEMVESSGLAESRTRKGIWFTHNDAGNDAILYAFTLEGEYVGSHAVTDASSWDWEAMSAGPCPGSKGDCLYIGDIGDNSKIRPYIRVYAVPEPAEGEDAQVIATWEVVYPDETYDSETLFVHPTTGRIYLVTKVHEGSSQVFRFPEEPTDDTGVLEYVATLDFESWGAGNISTTGGDWDWEGHRLVIRTYSAAYEWETDPCDPDAHWGNEPVKWPTSGSGGEAIAYDLLGNIVTSTEGDPMELKILACEEVLEGPVCDEPDTGPSPDTAEPRDSGVPGSDTDTDTDSSQDTQNTQETGQSHQQADEADPSFQVEQAGCGCDSSGGARLFLLPAILLWGRRRGGLPQAM